MIPFLIPKNKLTIGSPTTPYLGPLTFHRTPETIERFICVFDNTAEQVFVNLILLMAQ
ncbi:hypothetical protein QTP88_018049 [Uroleucon formosanum]